VTDHRRHDRKAGTLTLPEMPGLGCDVDPAFVKKLQKI